MVEERLVSPQRQTEESGLEPSLRPRRLDEYIGQERLKEAAKLGFARAIVPRANAPKQAIAGAHRYTPMMGFPLWPFLLALPVPAIPMLLFSVEHLLRGSPPPGAASTWSRSPSWRSGRKTPTSAPTAASSISSAAPAAGPARRP